MIEPEPEVLSKDEIKKETKSIMDFTPQEMKRLKRELRKRFHVQKPRKPEPVCRQALIARQKKARPQV